jgi:hypothetical protein
MKGGLERPAVVEFEPPRKLRGREPEMAKPPAQFESWRFLEDFTDGTDQYFGHRS